MKKIVISAALLLSTYRYASAQAVFQVTMNPSNLNVNIIGYGMTSFNQFDTLFISTLKLLTDEADKSFHGKTFQVSRMNAFGVATFFEKDSKIFFAVTSKNQYAVLIKNELTQTTTGGEVVVTKSDMQFVKKDVMRMGDQYSMNGLGIFYFPSQTITDARFTEPK